MQSTLKQKRNLLIFRPHFPSFLCRDKIFEPQYTLKTVGRHLSGWAITLAVILPTASSSFRNLWQNIGSSAAVSADRES